MKGEESMPAQSVVTRNTVPIEGTYTPPRTSETRSVVALRRGLSILDVFLSGREELGVNEIARLLDMHKSTVSRLCSTLEQGGYLARSMTSDRYRLGARMQQLTGASSLDLRAAARDVLHHLVEASGETVTMVVREGLDVLTVEVIDGPRMVRMQARIGAKTQIHASAGAKAIMANLPDEDVRRIIDTWPLVQLTPNTITDKATLLRNLAETRERGYSIDREEIEVGLRCVGAAVRDQSGRVVAGIACSGPRHRMGDAEIARLGEMVRQGADAISARLGAPAPVLLADESPGAS